MQQDRSPKVRRSENPQTAPSAVADYGSRSHSYAKLGLLPNLNPRQAGGIEPVEAVPFAVRSATAATMADLEALGSGDDEEEEEAQSDDDEEEDEPMASTSTAPAPAAPGTLTKGLGRIVRDENGKVIKIILGGEDGEEIEEEVKERVERDDDEEDDDDESDDEDQVKAGQKPSPWGQPMPDWSTENIEREPEQVLGPRSTGQGIPIFGGVRRSVEAKTDVVRGESRRFTSISDLLLILGFLCRA